MTTDRTEFRTVINGVTVYVGDDLETAIRNWDRVSSDNTIKGVKLESGEITVQQWSGEYMVRDGNILHVLGNGHIYLNPRIALK